MSEDRVFHDTPFVDNPVPGNGDINRPVTTPKAPSKAKGPSGSKSSKSGTKSTKSPAAKPKGMGLP